MMVFFIGRSTSSSMAGPRNPGRGLERDYIHVGRCHGGEAGGETEEISHQ